MHPMHPVITAYILAAETADRKAGRARLAQAANRPHHPRKPHGHRGLVLARARRIGKMQTTPCA
jgi:hypothetical protein